MGGRWESDLGTAVDNRGESRSGESAEKSGKSVGGAQDGCGIKVIALARTEALQLDDCANMAPGGHEQQQQ